MANDWSADKELEKATEQCIKHAKKGKESIFEAVRAFVKADRWVSEVTVEGVKKYTSSKDYFEEVLSDHFDFDYAHMTKLVKVAKNFDVSDYLDIGVKKLYLICSDDAQAHSKALLERARGGATFSELEELLKTLKGGGKTVPTPAATTTFGAGLAIDPKVIMQKLRDIDRELVTARRNASGAEQTFSLPPPLQDKNTSVFTLELSAGVLDMIVGAMIDRTPLVIRLDPKEKLATASFMPKPAATKAVTS